MAFTIKRIVGTQNDMGGSGAGRVIDETNFENTLGQTMNVHVSGLGITLDSPSSGHVTIASGVCVISGHYVDLAGSDSINLGGISVDDWYRVWLQLTEDGSGYVNGVQLTATQDTSIPSLAILLYEVRVSSGGSASDSYDRRARPSGTVGAWGSHSTPAGPGGKVTLGWRPSLVIAQNDAATNKIIMYDAPTVVVVTLAGTPGSPGIETYGFDFGSLGAPGSFVALR